MRDRLIELVNEAKEQYFNDVTDRTETDYIVECLLDNGVIVPPCKIGDTVYCIRYDKARKSFVKTLPVRSVTIWEKGEFTVFTSREDYMGKTVFLTREEAEQALKGGEG